MHQQLPFNSNILYSVHSRKFYIKKNNNKADSIETGRIAIAHLRLRSDLEKGMYTTLFN